MTPTPEERAKRIYSGCFCTTVGSCDYCIIVEIIRAAEADILGETVRLAWDWLPSSGKKFSFIDHLRAMARERREGK